MALVVVDERVSLPVPAGAAAETERDWLRPESEVALRLRWFPDNGAEPSDERDG